MKFLFSSNKTAEHVFHENLFKSSPKSSSFNQSDDEDEYIEENDYNTSNHKTKLELNDLSLPLTDTIAEFVQELSDDKFFINDISFIFELSRKRAISPCAIVVALIYLKRLKTKTQNSAFLYSINDNYYNQTSDKYSANCLSNTELCLISLLLASKYLVDEGEDDEIYNDEWADLVDFSVQKVNSIERSILKQLNWELYVSEQEFWNFTNKLTERITRKKVKYQHYHCTYTDLDYLLSYSKQFSTNAMKSNFNYLAKIILICSSTIVYMALSSFVISACVFYLKSHLSASINDVKIEVSIVNDTSIQNDLIFDVKKVNESNEKNLFVNFDDYNDNKIRSNLIMNETKLCFLNDLNILSSNFFRLFEPNLKPDFNLVNILGKNQPIKSLSQHYHLILNF